MAQHIHRKSERTPEEQARLREIREFYQRLKPTADELLASGEFVRPVSGDDRRELSRLLRELKQARLDAGLSLPNIAKQTGISEATLTGLDSCAVADVGLFTLAAYAAVLGKQVSWNLRDVASPTRTLAATEVK